MLQAQQARLIVALKNMSTAMDQLKTGTSSESSDKTGTSGEATAEPSFYQEEKGFDLSNILEKYAPSHKSNGTTMQDQSKESSSSEVECLSAKRRETTKRRRGNETAPTKTAPLPARVQDEGVSNFKLKIRCPEESAVASSDGDQINGHGMSKNNLAAEVDTDRMTDGTLGLPKGTNPYTSFMGMLHSMSRSPGGFNQPLDSNCDSYFAGAPAGGEVALANLTDMQDSSSVFGNTQLGPLIDMVDWDASWLTCSELMNSGNSVPLPPQQEYEFHDNLNWGI